MEPNRNGENPRFSANDLVWGKIKSHPWWPGQIIDPKHASEYAKKMEKEHHFLVAYFSDKSFAWVQDSQLRHFEPHFSEMVNQKGSLVFDIAVSDAVSEYSRRVQLSLACNCLKGEILSGLENNEIVNRGVKEGTYNKGVIASDFSSHSFLNFIRACALCPVVEVSMLDLARVIGQLKALNSWQGTNDLYVVGASSVDFVENDEMVEGELSSKLEDKRVSPSKVQVEVEENGTGVYVNESKDERTDVKKGCDEKHSEVEFDSCQKISSLEKSVAESEKIDRIQNLQEVGVKCNEVVCVDESESGVKSVKKKGRPRKIHKEGEVEKIDIDGEKNGHMEIESSAKSKKKRGRPRKYQDGGEVVKEGIDGDKNANMEFESSAKSKKKRGRPRKYQDEVENKHITYFPGDENVCTHETSDHKEEEKTVYTILSHGELGRGKRMKRKKDFDPPLLTSTKHTEHTERVKLSAVRAKKPLIGARLDGLFGEDYSSPDEMLSQLYSLAVAPMDASDFLSSNLKFLTGFKDFISSKLKEDQAIKSTGGKKGRKNKLKTTEPISCQILEADHVKDSYWSDIVFEDPLVGDGLQAESHEGEN